MHSKSRLFHFYLAPFVLLLALFVLSPLGRASERESWSLSQSESEIKRLIEFVIQRPNGYLREELQQLQSLVEDERFAKDERYDELRFKVYALVCILGKFDPDLHQCFQAAKSLAPQSSDPTALSWFYAGQSFQLVRHNNSYFASEAAKTALCMLAELKSVDRAGFDQTWALSEQLEQVLQDVKHIELQRERLKDTPTATLQDLQVDEFGNSLLANGDWKSADVYFANLLRTNEEIKFHAARALAQVERGDFRDALSSIEKGMKLPDVDITIRSVAIFNYVRSRIALESGDLDSCLAHLMESEQNLQLLPQFDDSFAIHLELFRNQLKITQGESEGIHSALEKIARSFRVSPYYRSEAFRLLSILLSKQGNYESAYQATVNQTALRNYQFDMLKESTLEMEHQRLQQFSESRKHSQNLHDTERKFIEIQRDLANERAQYAARDRNFLLLFASVLGISTCVLIYINSLRRSEMKEKEKSQDRTSELARQRHTLIESLQSQLRQHEGLQKTLERKHRDESIGQLTGNVAHDFNNLLQVIQASNEVIGRSPHLTTNARDMLSISIKSVEAGATIIAQLLQYARQQNLVPQSINIEEYLSKNGQLLSAIPGRGCSLEIVCKANEAHVLVDPTQLTTSLLNLIKNSVDSMPSGGQILLEVTLANKPAKEHAYSGAENRNPHGDNLEEVPEVIDDWNELHEGRYVRFAVVDTGKGISDSAKSMVFEPFYSTKTSGTGTGLGLSSVYGFVKQSEGDVRILDNKSSSSGTRVEMVFPKVAKSDYSEVAMSGSDKVDQNSYRMLLVEDNREVGASLLSRIRALGFQADIAHEGEIAISILEDYNDKYDIVVSDIRMPGAYNGIEFKHWVTQNLPGLPVVLMTGYSHYVESATGTVLRKPFSEVELLNAIASERAAVRRLKQPMDSSDIQLLN